MAVTITLAQYNASPGSYATGTINFSDYSSNILGSQNILNSLQAASRLGSLHFIDSIGSSIYLSTDYINQYYGTILAKINNISSYGINIGSFSGAYLTADAAASSVASRITLGSTSISDSSANISLRLSSLQTICSSSVISNVYLSDSGATLALSSTQINAGSAVLNKIQSSYSINATGGIYAAIAAGNVGQHINSTIAISDTGSNVVANIAAVQALDSRLGSISLSDALALSDSQFNTYYQLLTKISGPFNLTISAAALAANAQALTGLNIATLHLSNSGTVAVSLTSSDFNASYAAVSKINNIYTLSVTGGVSVNAAMSSAALTHLSSFTVSDSAANLSGKIGAWNGLSGYKPSSITLTDSSTPTLSMTAAQLLADSLGYSASILTKISSPFNIALTDSGSPVLTLSYGYLVAAPALSHTITTPHSFAVTGMTAANAVALSGRSDISSIAVSDTSANIVANLDTLKSWGNKLSSLYTSSTVQLSTAADFNLYANTLSILTSQWSVGVTIADGGAISAAAAATSAARNLAWSGPVAIQDTAANIVNIIVAGQSGSTYWGGISLYSNLISSISFTDTNPLITLSSTSNALGVFGGLIAPLIAPGTQYRVAFSSVMDEGNLAYFLSHQDFLSHFSPFSLSFYDGAGFSTYAIQLAALGSQFIGIDRGVNTVGVPGINITAAQFDSALMAKINCNYSLSITNATVSQALSIANLDSHLSSVTVIDTAQNFIFQHSALQALGSKFTRIAIVDTADHILNYLSDLTSHASEISTITITGSTQFAIAQGAAADNAAVLNKIDGGYTVVQSQGVAMDIATFLANLSNQQLTGVVLGDSSTQLAAHLDELQGVIGRISSIRVTDANPLLLTSSQINNDYSLLSKLSVPYTFNLIENNGLSVNAVTSTAFTHFSGRPSAASITDSVANIQANFDLLQAMASKIGNIYLADVALFEVNSYQLSHNTLLYSIYGADRVWGHYALYLNDASAAVAAAVATTGYASLPITNLRVLDTGHNIGNSINYLLTLKTGNKLMGIQVSDGNPIPVEYAQLQTVTNSGFFSDIQNIYSLKVQSVSAANAWTTHNIWNVSAVTVYDTKANVLANLNTLNALGNELVGIAFSDVDATHPLVLNASQFSNYQNVWQYVVNITVTDTAANLSANMDVFAAHVSEIKTPTQYFGNGQYQTSGGITLSDSSALSLTGAQLVNDVEALKKISGSYSIIGIDFTKATLGAIPTSNDLTAIASHIQSYTFKDIPSNIRGSLDLLHTYISKLSSVTIMGADPANIYFNQLTTDADVIAKITGPYTFNVQRVAVADAAATLALSHVSSIEINDTAANISANIDLLESLGSGILSIHAINAEPLSITSSQQTNDALTLAKFVNGAPEAHDKSFAMLFEASLILGVGDFGFLDGDPGDTAQKVKIISFQTPVGTLKLNNQVVHANDVIAASEITAGHLVYIAPGYTQAAVHPQITFQVSDGADYSSTHTFSFDFSRASIITPTPATPTTPTVSATYAIPISSIQSIGLSADGHYLIIKIGGVTSVIGRGESLGFTDSTLTTEELTTHITPIPVFKSSGGTSGYSLPDLYTGPASLGLKYQLIESADNAVVTGSSDNEFIKVSSSNSIGKAVNGNGGSDVIDGGVGSTFVTGGENHSDTFFLDGRAPGVSWSTITDFKMNTDKATIWGFVKGVSSIDTSFANYNSEGAAGYTGLTLHFKNLLPDGQTSGSNPNLNSITFSGHTLAELGASSLADLNSQINAGTNAHILVGATQDSAGTHSYLYIH